MHLDWSDFWEDALWGLGTLTIFIFTKVKRNKDDPMLVQYNLLRVAKYGSLMTSVAFLFNAIRDLTILLR